MNLKLSDFANIQNQKAAVANFVQDPLHKIRVRLATDGRSDEEMIVISIVRVNNHSYYFTSPHTVMADAVAAAVGKVIQAHSEEIRDAIRIALETTEKEAATALSKDALSILTIANQP